MSLHCLNIVGLIINATGTGLLIVFTSPGLNVSEEGESLVGWKNSPNADQRVTNMRKYLKHKYGFKAGVVLLPIGYVFQLIAASLG